MKLVDILAQELKAWPEGVDSVWQSSCDNEIYFDADVRPFYTSLNAEDSGTRGAVITQAEWQAAVDALNAPKVVEWDGSERPPVGTVCEIAESTQYLTIRYPEGTKVKVYAHFTDDRGIELVAFVDEAGKVGGVCTGKCFRPIRTAEQVAAEERDKAIKEICIDAGSPEMTPGQLNVAEKLYQAGYRKQVAK